MYVNVNFGMLILLLVLAFEVALGVSCRWNCFWLWNHLQCYEDYYSTMPVFSGLWSAYTALSDVIRLWFVVAFAFDVVVGYDVVVVGYDVVVVGYDVVVVGYDVVGYDVVVVGYDVVVVGYDVVVVGYDVVIRLWWCCCCCHLPWLKCVVCRVRTAGCARVLHRCVGPPPQASHTQGQSILSSKLIYFKLKLFEIPSYKRSVRSIILC
jgi:hypothetical protein